MSIEPKPRVLERIIPLWLFIPVILTSTVFAQVTTPRPHILGLAHVAFRAGNLERTRAFYESLLGFAEPFELTDPAGRTNMAIIKINDEQYVELLEADVQSKGSLDHFAVYTDDLLAMRRYLTAQRIPILFDIHKGRVGNAFLTIADPDGRHIEVLQYATDSSTGLTRGHYLPASRLSDRISHVGIVVHAPNQAIKFYREVLGFREFARGGGNGAPFRVDLRVPDGDDYVELLALADSSSPASSKAQDYLGLGSTDVRKTAAELERRPARKLFSNPLTLQTGDNLPARVIVFDPDGAELQIIEMAPSPSSSPEPPVHDR